MLPQPLPPASVGPFRCLSLRIRCWGRRHPRWQNAVWVAVLALIVLLALNVKAALGAEYRTFRVTAYCPCAKCCGKHADGITASGTRADHPLVAAPRSFPFGTAMSIPGYAGGRWVRVEDRGGAIKGNRLDVLFLTHKAALQWGVRRLKVRICTKKGDGR